MKIIGEYPCRYCFEKRTDTCHGTCKDYLSYKAQEAEKKKKEKSFNEKVSMKTYRQIIK